MMHVCIDGWSSWMPDELDLGERFYLSPKEEGSRRRLYK